MLAPSNDGWIGSELAGGRYRVISKLGEGGMGTVFRAWDCNLETDVVIKVPHVAVQQDPEFAPRFAREVSSLVRLSHPHIVKINDVGEHQGQPFAVMQFLPGGSLENQQQASPDGKNSPQLLASLKTWLPTVAQALDFVHGQGAIHRDVKPGNILFDSHGNAFLSDFGIAKFAASGKEAVDARSRTLTGAGMVIGTPEYMAPELIMGQQFDGRADQYALAITFFEILAGRRPFEDATSSAVLVQHASKEPPDLRSLNPHIPEAVAAAMRKALSKDPKQRFPRCEAFADAIVQAASTQPKSEHKETKAKCPVCQKSIRLTEKVRGKQVPCPACKSLLRIADDLGQVNVLVCLSEPAAARSGTQVVGARGSISAQPEESGATYGLASDVVQEAFDAEPPPAAVRTQDTVSLGQSTSGTKSVNALTPPEGSTKRRRPSDVVRIPPSGTKRLLSKGGIAAAALLLLGITIFVITRNGTVKISLKGGDDSIEVKVDGEKIAIAGLEEPITIRPGDHDLIVTSPRFESVSKSFKVNRGDTTIVEVTLQPKPAAAPGIAKSDTPGATPLEKPAVYSVELDPSQAVFSVEGDGVTVAGSGQKRTVSVAKPQPDKPIVLVARLQNFQEARRKLRPAPGTSEVIVLKLSPEPTPEPATPSNNETEPMASYQIQLDADQTIYQRSTLKLGGSFVSVPDELQLTLIADVDFGDGATTEPIELAPDLTFQLKHVYSEPGEYSVAVVVSDGKTAPLKASATVTVKELMPVPDAAALERSRATIRDLYKKEFSDANKSTAKLAWAEKLIEYGLRTKDAPTDRFVVLDEAALQAIEIPDPIVAFRAIDAIATTFDINPHAKKAELLALTVQKTKPTSLSLHKKSVEAGLAAIDDALSNNDFPAARDLLKTAQKAAELGKDLVLLKKVSSASETITLRMSEWDQFTKSKESLDAMPDDPDLNQAVGSYLCFTKGHWHQGMPYLAKSPNPKVSSLATSELERRHSVGVMLTLADGWFSLADEAEGESRSQMRVRAMYWYKALAPRLSGVSQQRVEQLIRKHEPGSSFLPRQWKLVQSFHKNGAILGGIAFSPDGKLLATGSAGNIVYLWEVNNGQIRKEIRNRQSRQSEVGSPVFLKDGKRFLFASGRNRRAELWAINGDNAIALFENDPNSETFRVAVSPNEEILALTGKSGIVMLWSAASGKPLRRIEHGVRRQLFLPFSDN